MNGAIVELHDRCSRIEWSEVLNLPLLHPQIPSNLGDLLGHSSVQTTMDVYTHAIPTLAEETVRNLGTLLGGRTVRD